MNTTSARTDVHTPSQIIPSDYREVAVWTMNIQGIGDCEFIRREREIAKADMERTGGQVRHFSNGSCGVCGNVQAIYLVLFHHAPSNDYITVGIDCAVKLGMSEDSGKMNLFRKNVANAREAQAGKRKAIAILSDLGLMKAWDIFTAEPVKHVDNCATLFDQEYYPVKCTCGVQDNSMQFPERTIRDIVGKLVRYGSVSEKQTAFVGTLLSQIAQRPIIEAQRQAEKDAAGPVPVGRVTMTGVVVGMKTVEREARYYGDNGVDTKLIIKLDNGSKVYGNRFDNLDKGDKVFFTASVQASKDDAKFGFYKRPVAAKTAEQIAEEKTAKKQAASDAKFIQTVAWA